MVFGFACDETAELMPLPISLAHKLAKKLSYVRKNDILDYLFPDGKTQVTVEYDEQGKPLHITAVVLSTQHAPDVTQEQIHADIKKHVFDVILPKELLTEETKYFINPTGRFVIGGPNGDSGVRVCFNSDTKKILTKNADFIQYLGVGNDPCDCVFGLCN